MSLTRVCGVCKYYKPIKINDNEKGCGICECPMPLWYNSSNYLQSKTMGYLYPAIKCPMFKYEIKND